MLRKSFRGRMIGVYAAAILTLALVGCGGGESSSPASGQATGHSGMSDVRTVLVFSQEPSPSPSQQRLHAGLEKGKLPSGMVMGTVLTDEDCAPDRQGISHCRNLVRLASGRTIVLRHPHNMTKVPCLAPGERVHLRRA